MESSCECFTDPVRRRCCRLVLSATWHAVNGEKKEAERRGSQPARQPGSLARPHYALMFTGCLVNEGETHTFVSSLLGTQRDASVFDYRTLRSWKGVCFDFNLCVASARRGRLNDPSLRNSRELRSLVRCLNLILSSRLHLLLVVRWLRSFVL